MRGGVGGCGKVKLCEENGGVGGGEGVGGGGGGSDICGLLVGYGGAWEAGAERGEEVRGFGVREEDENAFGEGRGGSHGADYCKSKVIVGN